MRTSPDDCLIEVTYYSSVKLSEFVVSQLASFTFGQLIDGVGENGVAFPVDGSYAVVHASGESPRFFEQSEALNLPYKAPTVAMAVFQGSSEQVLEALESASDSINLKYGGLTALNMAIHEIDLVENLIRLGADPNQKDGLGYYPLHALSMTRKCSEETKVAIANMLIRNGAEKTVKDNGGEYPFEHVLRLNLGMLAEVLRC
jgi:ankyrin repeat protein